MAFTEAEVKDVMAPGGDYNLRTNPSLAIPVRWANALIARVVTCAATKGVTLSQEEQDIMGIYLAAHSHCMSDQTYASKSTTSASGSFHGQTGMRLEATKYGQQAVAIDPSGCLNAIANAKRAGGFWAGKKESEELTYEERN